MQTGDSLTDVSGYYKQDQAWKMIKAAALLSTCFIQLV